MASGSPAAVAVPAAAAFARFKYKHADAVELTPARRRAFWIALPVALLVALVFFPLGLGALAVPLLLRFGVQRELLIGPRYLVCGSSIVYYGNVDRVEIDRAAGRLTLMSEGGKRLVLERERFPTNARKRDKIAANQAAKFNKVADKLADKVRHASSGAGTGGA